MCASESRAAVSRARVSRAPVCEAGSLRAAGSLRVHANNQRAMMGSYICLDHLSHEVWTKVWTERERRQPCGGHTPRQDDAVRGGIDTERLSNHRMHRSCAFAGHGRDLSCASSRKAARGGGRGRRSQIQDHSRRRLAHIRSGACKLLRANQELLGDIFLTVLQHLHHVDHLRAVDVFAAWRRCSSRRSRSHRGRRPPSDGCADGTCSACAQSRRCPAAACRARGARCCCSRARSAGPRRWYCRSLPSGGTCRRKRWRSQHGRTAGRCCTGYSARRASAPLVGGDPGAAPSTARRATACTSHTTRRNARTRRRGPRARAGAACWPGRATSGRAGRIGSGRRAAGRAAGVADRHPCRVVDGVAAAYLSTVFVHTPFFRGRRPLDTSPMPAQVTPLQHKRVWRVVATSTFFRSDAKTDGAPAKRRENASRLLVLSYQCTDDKYCGCSMGVPPRCFFLSGTVRASSSPRGARESQPIGRGLTHRPPRRRVACRLLVQRHDLLPAWHARVRRHLPAAHRAVGVQHVEPDVRGEPAKLRRRGDRPDVRGRRRVRHAPRPRRLQHVGPNGRHPLALGRVRGRASRGRGVRRRARR